MSNYGKPEVNEIMELFTQHMGIKPTPYARQRQYASTLTKLFGEQVIEIVKFAISIQDDYYAPRITSPKDLYYKASNVMDYYKKHVNNNENKVLR